MVRLRSSEAVPHVDYVPDPGTRTFIEEEMSKLFTDDEILPFMEYLRNKDSTAPGISEEWGTIPSDEKARSRIEAIRRYLKRYIAPDGSARYPDFDRMSNIWP